MTEMDRAREALSYVSAACDRAAWVRILAAIKSEFADDGMELADDWSQSAVDSYNAGDFRATWRSLRAEGGITIATLYGAAKENGWTPRNNGHPVLPTAEDIARREAARKAEDERQQQRREAARALAEAVWKSDKAERDTTAYLIRKGVRLPATVKRIRAEDLHRLIGYEPQQGDEKLRGWILVVPIIVDGALSSLEFIDEDGRKSALAGGRKQDGIWSPAKLPEGDGAGLTVNVGEGVATVLSAFESTDYSSVAAFSAGNLAPAAKAIRARLPKARIVILADIGNGQDKAHDAARAVGGLVATPPLADGQGKDFNDLHKLKGREAVKNAIRSAREPEPMPEAQPAPENRSGAILAGPTVRLQRGDLVTIAPIGWYWLGFLPAGKVVLLGGAPGTGKTTLAITLAATITIGGRWPDGTHAESGDVLVWSGEDAVADTLAPRFKAAGADMSRVHFVMGVDTSDGGRPFDPAQDFARLAEAAKDIPNLRLIIVDPIVMAVAGDSHKNAETRRGLQPLVDFAEKSGAVVVGITHFSKGTQGREPLERITGSLAFAAVARLVLVAAKVDEASGGGRIFVRSKSNLGPDGGGFKYELEETQVGDGVTTTRVLWGDALEGNARDILATAEVAGEPDDKEETRGAAEWLTAQLKDGELTKREIMRRAVEAGFSDRTVHRARQRIGAEAAVTGFSENKRSIWRLPNRANEAQNGSIVPIVPDNLCGTHGTNDGANGESEVL